jgi:hypothetical protein
MKSLMKKSLMKKSLMRKRMKLIKKLKKRMMNLKNTMMR